MKQFRNITQSMLIWHIDCFELKTLEKQQVKERYSDFPFLLKAGENSHAKYALRAPRGKEQSYHQRQVVEARNNLYP